MTITPERNDVDISVLFRWGKKVVLTNRAGNEILTCYLRLVGDAELNRARVFALRKSAEMRRLLKTMDSEERMALIADKDATDREKLIELIAYMNARDITMKAINKIEVPFPKEPKADATLEQQEEYQKAVDDWPTIRESKIRDYIENEINKLKKSFDNVSDAGVYKNYEDTAIAELCEAEMTSKFRQHCIYLGTYKDEEYKERLFESFDTFDNLPTEAKQQLAEEYLSLEISMDDLKK